MFLLRGSRIKVSTEQAPFNMNSIRDEIPMITSYSNKQNRKNYLNMDNNNERTQINRQSVGHQVHGTLDIEQEHSHGSNIYEGERVSHGHLQPADYNGGHKYDTLSNSYSYNSGSHYIEPYPYDSFQEDKTHNVGAIEHSYGLTETGNRVNIGNFHDESQIYSFKSFLIPLAGAAVLGLAAALFTSPVLLQLGSVTGGLGVLGKKRRRRDLNKKIGFTLGYKAQTMAYKKHMNLKR